MAGDRGPAARLIGAGDEELRFPSAVAVDGARVVVGDQRNHRVQIFDRDGRFVRAFGGAVPRAALGPEDYVGRFTRVQGLALTADRIYVLDSYHARVQVFDAERNSLGFVGERGDCASCLGLALDVALGADGELLVADPDHRRWVTLAAPHVAEEVTP